jgi:hypothetical protein
VKELAGSVFSVEKYSNIEFNELFLFTEKIEAFYTITPSSNM